MENAKVLQLNEPLMTRDNPSSVRVDATLTGKYFYHAKILLSMFDFGNGVTVDQETLLPGQAIQDGDYVMRYTVGGKDYVVNRRVTDGAKFLRRI